MQIGDIIEGKYRIESALGTGGFGDVWVATQLSIDREVAIKVLHSFSETVERRFSREAQILARLDHPHCVKLFDYGQLPDGTPFLVMQFAQGKTFDRWLDTNPPQHHRMAVAHQITDALRAAHGAGIVHRDLKPDNIVVTSTVEGPHVVILDFGIAKLTGAPEQDITKTGDVLGTPGYMSPEQLRATREAGPAADLYALGALLYEMFEGRPPFEGDNALQLAMAHLSAEVPVMRTHNLPDSVRALIVALLAKHPGARPPSAAFVLQQLTPTPTQVAQLQPPVEAEVNRTGLWLSLGALVCVGIAGVMLWPDSPTKRPVAVTPPPQKTQKRPTQQRSRPPEPVAPSSTPDGGVPLTGRCPTTIPDLDQLDLDLQLPLSYPSPVPHPLIVVVHDYAQGPEEVLASTRLIRLAEERQMVVLAPRDSPTKNTWTDSRDRRRIEEAIDKAISTLCIDPKRVFLVGLGNGARPTHSIACQRPSLAAVVASGWRIDENDRPCRGKERPPFLLINPLNDPAAPVQGGSNCTWADDVLSLRKHEELVRQKWGCTGYHPPATRPGCAEMACEHSLNVCRASGGRYWAEFPIRSDFKWGAGGCVIEPPGTDYLGEAFLFIDEHDPGPSEAEDAPDDVERVGHPAAP